jgi:hypothetical protein
MALIENASGVYAKLGYNFSDPNGNVTQLSNTAINHLDSVPPLMDSWQAKDIANNSVGGYFQNPVATDVNTIITLANEIATIANTANIDSLVTTASQLSSTGSSFLDHTNRISGVTPWTGDNTIPYYQNAMNLGKTALYLTNQTDGITDNSPIMGSFTSILIGPQIKAAALKLAPYPNLLSNSLVTSSGTDADGNPTTSTTSNLPSSQFNQITSDLNYTAALLSNRQTADVNFFNNLKTFSDNYQTVKQFSNMGDSQEYLINNFIGSDKLKSRINS